MKPMTINTFGDPIYVREDSLPEGYGQYDPTTGTIIIEKDQPEAGKHIILIHEIFHLIEHLCIDEGLIRDRVDHDFVTYAAPILLKFLVDMGLYTKVTAEQLHEFMDLLGREGGRS
jgi:hypothetical protein